MDEKIWLAQQFEANRTHLRGVAYRMLGSLSEAEDAVQEAWLKLSRAGGDDVENLSGWLTTVVARVCLDMLRSRKSRREQPLVPNQVEASAGRDAAINPQDEAELADSVGLALLVILKTLAPAERLAFVLHDLFAMPFDEIAAIAGRSPAAARQLASRARRRVQGNAAAAAGKIDLTRQREVVDAYLTAARGGDLQGLLAVLDPDVVLRTDGSAVPAAGLGDIRGARAVAEEAVKRRAQFARPVLVNGAVGIVVAPFGRLVLVLSLTFKDGKIAEMNVISDQAQLEQLELGLLEG